MTIQISDNIFRQYDIRGIYDKDLTDDFARLLAVGLSAMIREKTGKSRIKVSIGRDVRLSSDALKDALATGFISSGVDCVDLGPCPTPLQYFSLHTMELDGGVMITGSHNPAEYNGFKVSIGKETLHGEEIQELKGYILKAKEEEEAKSEVSDVKERRKNTNTDPKLTTVDIITEYIDFHLERFTKTLPQKPKRQIKIVLDAGNGTGGLVAPELLRKLGFDIVELYCEVDGTFPNHHPDPTVEENLVDLIAEVKKEKADFGVGYDGDSDRIGLVDENGTIIWGDQLMIVFARDILAVQPGATIVAEVKCSQVMYDEIEKLGGRGVMWKTGHSLIKSRMKELDAAMAGEMSGHIFFADRYFGFDDAVYATCRAAEILTLRVEKEPKTTFSSLLKGLPGSVVTPEIRIECPDSEKFKVVDKLKTLIAKDVSNNNTKDLKIKDIIDIDGLRIVFEGGWALVRASNTGPVLVTRFEAQNGELLKKFKDFLNSRLKATYPELK